VSLLRLRLATTSFLATTPHVIASASETILFPSPLLSLRFAQGDKKGRFIRRPKKEEACLMAGLNEGQRLVVTFALDMGLSKRVEAV